MLFDRNFLNILQLGLGFLLVFTAYQTCANIQQFVVNSIENDRKAANETGPPIASDSGYLSSAIVYAVFTASNFLAPPIVDAIGQKWSMVLGAIFYLLYLTSFLYLTTIFLYVCSALLGFGAAVIWVGQGTYLAKNSNPITASRNSGVFWAMFQFSLFVGGLIAFFSFNSQSSSDSYLTTNIINIVYICFSVLAAVGIVILGLLRKPTKVIEIVEDKSDSPQKNRWSEVFDNFMRTVKLSGTTPQLLLMFVFMFTGLEQGFWGGVYGTSLGNTSALTSHKDLVALNGIFVGIGETIGGAIFGIFGKQVNRFGRIPVVILGLTTNMIAFLLIFLSIPSEAPVNSTLSTAYISPNQYLALFCSLLLGFADACWNTQIYSLLSTFYAKDSAPAFGLYKFFQSAATCASYFYSGPGKLYLQWQLLIVGIAAPIAGFCFVNAQWIMTAQAAHEIKAIRERDLRI